MKKILIINGPNLNLLGKRQPELYGKKTLEDIEKECLQLVKKYPNVQILFYQSNMEGELVERVQQAKKEQVTDIIINAGAYTHTSIALLDALKYVDCTIYEVHLSNIFSREEFRHKSYISSIANAVISGLKEDTYTFVLNYICKN